MTSQIPRYPLTWPPGRPRTPAHQRRHAPFKTSADHALHNMLDQIRMLGGRDVILSSNMKVRQDGFPYAQQPRHSDEGIAVYFRRKGTDYAFACDSFHKREHNIHAIGKTIEALRGIERWGSTGMLEQAFTGFEALPAPGGTEHWRDVLDPADPEGSYRRMRAAAHPDRGGDAEAFQRVQRAWEQYQAERA